MKDCEIGHGHSKVDTTKGKGKQSGRLLRVGPENVNDKRKTFQERDL